MNLRTRLLTLTLAAATPLGLAAPLSASAASKAPTLAPSGPSCGAHSDPWATVTAWRFHCTPAQLDALYASLPAGSMPGWDVPAHARARIVTPLGVDSPVNYVWSQLWQGQTYYTHKDGGYLWQRAGGDHESFWAPVVYGPSFVDGKRAIVVTYYHDIFKFIRLELRELQPGIYIGSSMHSTGRHERQAYVIEDFVHPEVSFPECLFCGPHRPT